MPRRFGAARIRPGVVTVRRVIEVRDCLEDDLEAVWRIRALAFDFSGVRHPDPDFVNGWGARDWHGWVGVLDGRVSAFARVWPLRQHFGGAAVPMAGLASVAVDPHARGRGVGRTLLDGLLPDLRERGWAVSALYPSVPGLYRSRGWEFAGVTEWVTVPPEALLAVPLGGPGASDEDAVALRPADESDVPALRECYAELAREVDGLLDRSSGRFDLARALELDVVTVAVSETGTPRGFLTASRAEPGLVVYELVALSSAASRALLRSVGSWAGQLPAVRMRLVEPRLLQPASYGVDVSAEQWMLRVVDLPSAVRARGWPRATHLRPELFVDIDVVDPLAPWHAGPHRLVVHGDTVGIEPGGSGAVRLTPRGLAAWYAGAAPVSALRRHGLLDGDAAVASVLDALTGTPGLARLGNEF
jgi:predicted acetyltransferase